MKKYVKLLFAIGAAVCVMLACSAMASAETLKGTATFDGSDVKLSLSDAEIAAKLNNLSPKDTLTITFEMINKSSQRTDWYVQDQVIKAFEDDSTASNGAYSFKLSYTNPAGKETVIKSSGVGGESSSGPVGLHQATSGTEKYYFLDTLQPNDKGLFSLYIAIEGETSINDYQKTMANIKVNFAVEEHKIGGTKTVKSGKSSSSKGLLTGDSGRFILYLVLLVVSLAVLFTVLGLQTKSRRK